MNILFESVSTFIQLLVALALQNNEQASCRYKSYFRTTTTSCIKLAELHGFCYFWSLEFISLLDKGSDCKIPRNSQQLHLHVSKYFVLRGINATDTTVIQRDANKLRGIL